MQRLKWFQFWQRQDATYWDWIESIIITVIILAICYASNPTNPLFVNSIFAWPWLAAIIIALRYGFGPGAMSIVIIAAAILFHTSANALGGPPYQHYLLTGMLITFICALFSSSWMQRVLRAEELYKYTEQRLDTLSRSYNVLRVSYDYLEQSLIAKPITLREIEKGLQQSLVGSGGEINATNAKQFLTIISEYCSLRDAGIYLFQSGRLSTQPIAYIGTMQLLDTNDPLVHYVLNNNKDNYVTLMDMADPKQAGYIAVVPMYASNKQFVGIIAIKEISFWRLNSETMQIIQILSLYFAEEASVVQKALDLLLFFPDCPPDFLKEINKLLYLKKSLGIDSSIVAIRINRSDQVENILYSIKKQQRGFDYLWHRHLAEADILLTLMPFTNAVGLNGYLSRVNKYLFESHGKGFQDLGISERSVLLYDQKPEIILNELLDNIMETG